MMNRRGRRTAEDVAAAAVLGESQTRLACPAHLTPEERERWETIVGSRSPEWFRPEMTILLEEFVIKKTVIDKLREKLNYERNLLYNRRRNTKDDYAGIDALLKLINRETAQLFKIASHLRLTPRSLMTHKKRPGRSAASEAVFSGSEPAVKPAASPRGDESGVAPVNGNKPGGKGGVAMPWQ